MGPKFCGCVTQHVLDHIWNTGSSFGSLSTRKALTNWSEFRRSRGWLGGTGHISSCEEKLRVLGLFSLEKRNLQEDVRAASLRARSIQRCLAGGWEARGMSWNMSSTSSDFMQEKLIHQGNSGTSFPGSFWSVHPWSFASPNSVFLCSSCSFEQEVELETF